MLEIAPHRYLKVRPETLMEPPPRAIKRISKPSKLMAVVKSPVYRNFPLPALSTSKF